jgi:hypothetical protein
MSWIDSATSALLPVRKRQAVWIAAAVLALTLAAGLWHGSGYGAAWRYQWITSLVLAAATSGIGLAVRHRRVPAFLAWPATLAVSAVTFYAVEKPMQRAGRWIAARGRG